MRVNMLLLYAISRPDDLVPEIYQELYHTVSQERQKRIDSYRRNEDKIRALLAESLLRYVLKQELSVPSRILEFQYNEYGKPSIRGIKHIQFNLSHSGNWIICGIGDSSIGIDVEEYKNIGLDIAKRYFLKVENSTILSAPEDRQMELFYKIWTLKESYVKAAGLGLSIPLNSFYFKFHNNDIEFYDQFGLQTDYNFKNCQIDSHHTISVCWKGNQKELVDAEFKEINILDLCSPPLKYKYMEH